MIKWQFKNNILFLLVFTKHIKVVVILNRYVCIRLRLIQVKKNKILTYRNPLDACCFLYFDFYVVVEVVVLSKISTAYNIFVDTIMPISD